MEELTITLTPEMLTLIPVVAAIIQLLKRSSAIQKISEWLPFVSIGLSLGISYLMKVPNPVVPSIVVGLVASGAYDLLKAPTVNKN